MIRKLNIKIETVITLVVVIVSVGVAYGSLTTRVTTIEKKTDTIQQIAIDVSVIKEKVSNIENTINNRN
tara:strand:- start:202 stop:408 length:207 start_codon:yes stop_codon:yes gene_type:complete